jgi:ribosomal protein S18
VGVVVDGNVVSVRPFTGERFRGRTFRVTGLASDADAQRLARAIRKARPLR